MMIGDRMLRGTITRVTPTAVYVEVPKLGQGVEYGPCQVLESPFADSADPAGGHRMTDQAGTHAHTTPVDVAVTVTVATVDGSVSSIASGSGTGTSSQPQPDSTHRHALKGGPLGLKVGQPVLVTTVNGVKEDLVVIGRLT